MQEPTKSKNKKKKNKKKKAKAKKEIDPWKEAENSIVACTEKLLPSLKEVDSLTNEDDKNTAKNLFDPSIMKTLNMILTMSNRFADTTYLEAIEFFEGVMKHLNMLRQLKDFSYLYEISQFLKNLHTEIPIALIRALAEKVLFPDPNSIKIFGKLEMHTEYLRDYVTEIFPNIWTYFDGKIFRDFLQKFALMSREGLLRQLRNISNQQKNLKRFYEDLVILINEANFTDDQLINKKKYPGKTTTPSLTISINLVTEAMSEFLKLGFPLDLYAPYEFAMIFQYLSTIFGILQNNRRIMVIGFCEEEVKKGQITFENNEENKEFTQKRGKMTDLQKFICDQFLFFNAIQELYSGCAALFMILMKEGFIKNPLRGKFGKDKGENHVERNAYRRRFYLFKYLNFPRYYSYEAYEETYNKICGGENEEGVKFQREHLMKGMKLLNQLKSTDESLRNTKMLSNEEIENICKIAANNLFALMKAKAVPEGKKLKISIDTFKNEWLPQIDIDYVDQ